MKMRMQMNVRLSICSRCGKDTLIRGYTDNIGYLCGVCYDRWVDAQQRGTGVSFTQWCWGVT